jgi:hypothetical protein
VRVTVRAQNHSGRIDSLGKSETRDVSISYDVARSVRGRTRFKLLRK